MPQAIDATLVAAARQPNIAFVAGNSSKSDRGSGRGQTGRAGCRKAHASVGAHIESAIDEAVKFQRIHPVRCYAASVGQAGGSGPRVTVISRKERSQSLRIPDHTAGIGRGSDGSASAVGVARRIIVSLEPVCSAVKTERGAANRRTRGCVAVSHPANKGGRSFRIVDADVGSSEGHRVHRRRRCRQIIMAEAADVPEGAIQMCTHRRTNQIKHRCFFNSLGCNRDMELPARVPGEQIVGSIKSCSRAVEHVIRIKRINLQAGNHPA